MTAPTSRMTPEPADPNDLRTALTKLAVPMYYDATPGAYPVTAVPMSHLLSALAAHPAPTPVEDHLDAACAWSDFRKDYGVSGDDKVRRREHRAFMAGWQSARGTIDAGGVQR